MKILFIAPLPPPITGHSLVSEVLRKDLEKYHDVVVVDTKKDSSVEGMNSLKRILEVIKMIIGVWKKKRNSDAIYLTISESFAGNVKDLFIYIACFNYLSKFYIHLHGGSLKKQLWDRYGFLYKINRYFIRKVGGVIISGQSHQNIFKDIIDARKLHIVPNFSQDYFFASKEQIEHTFSNMSPLRILYLSSLRRKKGYMDLLDAFYLLDDADKRKICIDFAGNFESETQKLDFLMRTKKTEQIRYYGQIDESTKKNLLQDSHIFCLPTKYYEGQPISILEAYASGCLVVTTGKGGIVDIFKDNENGFLVKEGSPQSIAMVFEQILDNSKILQRIALNNNRNCSKRYREVNYCTSIRHIIEGHSPSTKFDINNI